MPQKTVPSFLELELKSFQDWNGDHPSQTLVFHDDSSLWWIKVKIAWALPEPILRMRYLRRRSMFQEFIKAIDFGQLDLLDDTVTRIILTMTEHPHKPVPIRRISDTDRTGENYFLSIAHRMSFQIGEDPGRTVYPALNQAQDLPTFEASLLEDHEVIAPAVSIVRFKQGRFAYKKIDRPIYEPGDTEHILNEIAALSEFRGQPNIAQLVGLVISDNPYKTRLSTISPRVITGFLLEYYPEGSLEQALSDSGDQDDALLRRWAIQTGKALKTLHTQRRTHLDIKPSNVVFDTNKNAILIDISGTGGYGWEWLSPEMQQVLQRNPATGPAGTSFDQRMATDCWAYGKLLSMMARKMGTGNLRDGLQSIADDLTTMDPEARISLSDALERMEV